MTADSQSFPSPPAWLSDDVLLHASHPKRPLLGFVMNAIAFAALQSAILVCFLWQFYDVRADNPLYEATVVKHRRLAEAPSPRLILVGGSNLLFGMDSTMIEAQTKYAPVNMGLIGGLRLPYMLNEAQASARPGDLVVISIEHNSLKAEPGESSLEVVLGIATCRPANLAYLHWRHWRRVLDSEGLKRLGLMFRLAVKNVNRAAAPDENSRDARRLLANINKYGDLTLYHPAGAKLPRGPNNQETLGPMSEARVRANIHRINEFAQQCERRGVRVVYAAPPVPSGELARRRRNAERYDAALRQHLKIPMLLRPAETTFADDGFIGKSYHLHGPAVQERTQQLIDAVLHWESPTAGAR